MEKEEYDEYYLVVGKKKGDKIISTTTVDLVEFLLAYGAYSADLNIKLPWYQRLTKKSKHILSKEISKDMELTELVKIANIINLIDEECK